MADLKVNDMGLVEFGRKETNIAEHELPGPMAARKKFGPSQLSEAWTATVRST